MHDESLLRIPLVRHLRDDKRVHLEPRRVDNRWRYEGFAPVAVTGFNPFLGRVFYAQNSFLARWLQEPERSARELNEGDFLVREVLFAVHDYLHVWSLFAINGLCPDLGIGVTPITRDNVEDFVFCHLLTETAAVVGLDYWYLSNLSLNDVVSIGTTVSSLTVDYHESHAAEYRRFNPQFVVQDAGFFGKLAEFYCDGVFRGFDVHDLKRSPRILSWLRHELLYGVSQRVYIRQWLRYLSGNAIDYGAADLAAPVDVSASWKKRLIREVSERLWEKVKLDHIVVDGVPIDDSESWRSPRTVRPDFRFLNVNEVSSEAVLGMENWENSRTNFEFYLAQYVSSFAYDSFDPALRQLVPVLRERRDAQLVQRLFKDQKALPARKEFPDLLILN